MARRKRGTAPQARRRRAWLSIAAAYSIGAVFVAAGVLVLLFGKEEPPQAGEDPVGGTVARLGIGLISLGLLAFAIVGYMHWVKSRH